MCYAGREDMFGETSHEHLHLVPFAEDPDLSGLHLRQATFERERHRLGPKIRLEPGRGSAITILIIVRMILFL